MIPARTENVIAQEATKSPDEKISFLKRKIKINPEDLFLMQQFVSENLRSKRELHQSYRIDEKIFGLQSKKLAMNYIQSLPIDFQLSSSYDPSRLAFLMVQQRNAPVLWAQKIIERAKVGRPDKYAQMLFASHKAPLEWAKKVIENSTCGDPPYAGFDLLLSVEKRRNTKEEHETREWLINFVENAKIGDRSEVAFRMFLNKYHSKRWLKYIVENDKTGNSPFVARMLCERRYVKKPWAKKIIENAVSGDPLYAAMCLNLGKSVLRKLSKKMKENPLDYQ